MGPAGAPNRKPGPLNAISALQPPLNPSVFHRPIDLREYHLTRLNTQKKPLRNASIAASIKYETKRRQPDLTKNRKGGKSHGQHRKDRTRSLQMRQAAGSQNRGQGPGLHGYFALRGAWLGRPGRYLRTGEGPLEYVRQLHAEPGGLKWNAARNAAGYTTLPMGAFGAT